MRLDQNKIGHDSKKTMLFDTPNQKVKTRDASINEVLMETTSTKKNKCFHILKPQAEPLAYSNPEREDGLRSITDRLNILKEQVDRAEKDLEQLDDRICQLEQEFSEAAGCH